MKVFQLLLVLCLIISLSCKTDRQILACAISNFGETINKHLYTALLNSNYATLLGDITKMKEMMKSCS